jgi:hypothetical protein
MGYFPTTHAVFGAMADKDWEPMLTKVGPLVDRWYFTDLPTPRADSAENLKAKLQQLQAQGVIRKDVSMQTFANPQQALDAAVAASEAADRIVVFGSFFTVGGVLQNGTPRLNAKHLAHGVSGLPPRLLTGGGPQQVLTHGIFQFPLAWQKRRSRARGWSQAPQSPAQGESVEAMRRRARHRLIGAAVLVLIGVVGFPLLFDTQPRPIPVNIPIEIPDQPIRHLRSA